MWMWFGLSVAFGEEPCLPTSGRELDNLAEDARGFLEKGEVVEARATLERIDQALQCFEERVDSATIAETLVVRAILLLIDGKDWRPALDRALMLRPSVDRIVGPASPLYDYEPSPEGASLALGRRAQRVYLDGVRVDQLPLEAGYYVLQRSDGDDWNTVVLRDQIAPMGWASSLVEPTKRLEFEFQVELRGGAGLSSQVLGRRTRSLAPSELVLFDDFRRRSPYAFVGSRSLAYPERWESLSPSVVAEYGTRVRADVWVNGRVGGVFAGDLTFGHGVGLATVRAAVQVKLSRRIELGAGGAQEVDAVRRRVAFDTTSPIEAERLFGVMVTGEIRYFAGYQRQFVTTARLGYRAPSDVRLDTSLIWVLPREVSGGLDLHVGGYGRGGLMQAVIADSELRIAGRQAILSQFALHVGVLLGGRFGARL